MTTDERAAIERVAAALSPAAETTQDKENERE